VEIEPDTNKFRVGVAIPLPVWNQRGGQVGEALAAFHEATAAAEARRLDLVTELENAYGRYQVASQQIAAYEGGLLKQAENALRVADAAYRFGERGFMEVLDAQRVLRTVRTELVAARFEQQAALIEIERLRGADSERTGS
jgi:cobalt-zinc-cadmium efflux system outer membrane protein